MNFFLQVHFLCKQSDIGPFAFGVIDTGGKFTTVLLIPVVYVDLQISSRIFEQIWNKPNVIFRGF